MIDITITLRGHSFTYRAHTDDLAEAKRRAAAFAKKIAPNMDSRGLLYTPLDGETVDVRMSQ